jgi:hypothetical protein
MYLISHLIFGAGSCYNNSCPVRRETDERRDPEERKGFGTVAQWESTALAAQGLWVRIPSVPPKQGLPKR